MSTMAILLSHGPYMGQHLSKTHGPNSKLFAFSTALTFPFGQPSFPPTLVSKSFYFGVKGVQPDSAGVEEPENCNDSIIQGESEVKEELLSDKGSSFLAKLAIGLGVAATVTLVCAALKQQTPEPSFGIGIQRLVDSSSSSNSASLPVGFAFDAFGYRVTLPEYTPGWIYFWLLMAAGCGLFVSEEALNIWVGISLARKLGLDGTWQSFVESFSRNAPFMLSTVLWVYWGVCISDMIPFYVGKIFRQSGASDDVCSKLGIGKDKLESITRVVQRYGNLSGFVERFSVGVRNPTAFLAGAMGVSPECFFAGVCCGSLITLSIQLMIGFLLRDRPLVALASVATIVGVWTVFPYVIAASTSLFFYLRRRYSS